MEATMAGGPKAATSADHPARAAHAAVLAEGK